MKNAIVIHRNDVDGIISGALLERYYGTEKLIFCSYSEQEEVFRQLVKSADDAQIHIADICAKDFPAVNGKRTLLEELAFRAAGVKWYDHHGGTKEMAALFNRYGHTIVYGGEGRICSAELIRRDLFPEAGYAEFVSRVAQAHDYPPLTGEANEAAQTGLKLQKIISLYNAKENSAGLADLVRLIAQGESWYCGGNFIPELRMAVSEFNRLIYRASVAAIDNRTALRIKGRSFMITCAAAIMPQKETMIRLRHDFKDFDGVAVYFMPPDGQLLFFKGIGSDFDAQKFCEFMGGGGREGNGGYAPQKPYRQENFGEFMETIAGKLREFVQ